MLHDPGYFECRNIAAVNGDTIADRLPVAFYTGKVISSPALTGTALSYILCNPRHEVLYLIIVNLYDWQRLIINRSYQ